MPNTTEEKDTYTLTFDFKKGETDAVALLGNIAEVLHGFEEFNKAICKGIDSEIDVASYLVDVENGSIKVKMRDVLRKIPDQVIRDLVSDPKKVVGEMLVAAKHAAIKKLDETKQLPQEQKEQLIYEAVCEEVLEAGLNPLLPCEINKDELLSSVSDITRASKKIDKVSFSDEEVEEACVIEANFSYSPPPLPQTMVQSFDAVLIVKKPDLYGTSRWSFVFDRQIDATIEDEPFLERVKNHSIGFFADDKISCRLRMEVSLNERHNPIETRYFVEKVLSVIKASDPEHPQLFD